MKKIFFTSLMALAVSSLVLVSCSDDEPDIVVVDGNGNNNEGASLSANISSDMTLTADTVWNLNGRITVEPGATLTIEAGAVLKFAVGNGANASSLVVARGGTLNAMGTADAPIIMTSQADLIGLGALSSPNLDQNDRGLWGGLILLGNAPISADADEQQIEGIPASDTNGLYGGDDPNDSSGTIRYVSIRHAGTELAPGNELNGLTLGGVGSGTTIEFIEVVANSDDAIEFFGGNVNASNLIVWAQGDDGIDIDQAYSGTVSNAAVVLGVESDHALEIDGPEGALDGAFILDGITLIGNQEASGGEYADYRDGAQGATNNVFARGFVLGSSDVELSANNTAQSFLDGTLSFDNWVIGDNAPDPANLIFVEDPDDDDGEVALILNPDFTTQAATWTSAGTDGGANLDAFSGWSITALSGALKF